MYIQLGADRKVNNTGIINVSASGDVFNTQYAGTVAFATDSHNATTIQFPLGVSFAKKIETSSGWNIKPSVDLGVLLTTGNTDTDTIVRIPGVASHTNMSSDIADTATFQGGLNFNIAKGNLNFTLDYDLNASEHLTSHGVFGSFRYDF